MDAQILVLTGESGNGKTTLCAQVTATLKLKGLDIAGVLSLPRLQAGVKTGILVADVRSGAQRLLAEPAAEGQGTANLSWTFDPAALAWGADALARATPCQVLVVDELGPLELTRGQGWAVALDLLRAHAWQVALVVVRPALVEQFRKQFGEMRIRTIAVTRAEQPEQYQAILRLFESTFDLTHN